MNPHEPQYYTGIALSAEEEWYCSARLNLPPPDHRPIESRNFVNECVADATCKAMPSLTSQINRDREQVTEFVRPPYLFKLVVRPHTWSFLAFSHTMYTIFYTSHNPNSYGVTLHMLVQCYSVYFSS